MSDLNKLLGDSTADVELPNLDDLWTKGRRQRRNRNIGRGIGAAAIVGVLGVGGVLAAGAGGGATSIDGVASDNGQTEPVVVDEVFIVPTLVPDNSILSTVSHGDVSKFAADGSPLSLVTEVYTVNFVINGAADPMFDVIHTSGDLTLLQGPILSGVIFHQITHGDQLVAELSGAAPDRAISFVENLEVVDQPTFIEWVSQFTDDREQNPSVEGGPTLRDHWHVAFGLYDCGEFAPDHESEFDPVGIHTHNDGLIHIHPFSTDAAGADATLGLYASSVEYTEQVATLAGRSTCTLADGTEAPAEFKVLRWSEAGNDDEPIEEIADWQSVRFLADGEVLVVALVPVGETVPQPPSTSNLQLVLGE